MAARLQLRDLVEHDRELALLRPRARGRAVVDAITGLGGPQLDAVLPTWMAALLLCLVRCEPALGRLGQAATRRLRRLGIHPDAARRRATHRRGPASLTEREREVAALVAQGHANQQIAAALYLRETTIANTLTGVYAKLGVRSRTQLARTPDCNALTSISG